MDCPSYSLTIHFALVPACVCFRYRTNAYAWELLVLESRFVTMAAGAILYPTIACGVCIFVTVAILGLHIKLKPFLTTPEEEAHWSSANKMGTLGLICTLVMLFVGLKSLINPDDGGGLDFFSLVGVVALVLPLILTLVALVTDPLASTEVVEQVDDDCVVYSNPLDDAEKAQARSGAH